MLNQPMVQPGGRRLAAGIVLALLLGIATPVLTVIEISALMPVILLNGVLMVFLYGYSGRTPAWIYMIVQLGAAAVLMGSTYMWMTLVSGVFPAFWAMRGIIQKRRFFEQLRTDIALSLAGLLAALLIAWFTFGGNMIGRMTDAVRAQFDSMPDDLFAPLVDAINRALPSENAASMSVADYRERFMAVLTLLSETYAQVLPGRLLSGAALSGVLTALWGNWLMARRGMATNESYVGLGQWFLPAQAVLGLMLLWLSAYLITGTGYAPRAAVYLAVYDLVSSAFYIQGLGAVDRFLYRRGASAGKRRAIVALALVFGLALRVLNTGLFIIGAISALFGSHGVLKRRPPNQDKDSMI